jgi:hypothetical protein
MFTAVAKKRRGRQPDRREARFFTVVPARALLAALEQRLCDTKVHSAQAGSGGTVRGSTTTPRGAQRAYRPEARTPGRAPAVARPPSTLSDVTTLGSPSVGTAAGDSPTSRVQGCRRRGAPWPKDPAQLAGVAPHAFVRDATRRRRATAGVRSRVQPLKTKKTEKPNAAKRVGGRRSANYATFLSAVPNVLVPRSTAPPPTLPSSACTTMVRTTAACHNTLTHARYYSHLGVCTTRFLLDSVRHRRHGKRPKLGRTTRRSSQHFCTTSVGSSPGPLLLKSTRPLDFLWTMRKAALSA